ncbi:MAG: TolB family protein, partial [Nitrososphaerales archaeon]
KDVAQRAPVFSPDGRKLALTYKQDNHWEVHVANANGSGETRLTSTPLTVIVDQQLKGKQAVPWNNAAPAWSPDGSQIIFLTDRNGQWEIWAMNADGSNQHPLLAGKAAAGLNIQYHGVDERVLSWR